MRLLLADDHNLFREALVHYIKRIEGDADVLLAKDIDEVMDIMTEESNIDLVLLDFRMPGMNGLSGLKNFKEAYPETKVALLSGLAKEQDIDKAIDMGIAGYFPKTLSGKALVAGIKDIIENNALYIARDESTGRYLPTHFHDKHNLSFQNGLSAMGESVQDNLREESDFSLTPRERDVLEFLIKGASNKDIARELDLQVVTIKLHVRGICRKLGAKNRTQAALIARENGYR